MMIVCLFVSFKFIIIFSFFYLDDSVCIINTNLSSLSSGMIPNNINSQCNAVYESSSVQNYQPSTYFYDLKLAELMRNSQRPSCIYLDPQPCQSSSTDYGFVGSNISPSSISHCSTNNDQSNINSLDLSIEMDVDHLHHHQQQQQQQQRNKNCFVSTQEYIV